MMFFKKKRIIDPGHAAIQVNNHVYALFPPTVEENECSREGRFTQENMNTLYPGVVKQETESQLAAYYKDLFFKRGKRDYLLVLALEKQVRLEEGTRVLFSDKFTLPMARVAAIPTDDENAKALEIFLIALAKMSRLGKNIKFIPDYCVSQFNCVSFTNDLLVGFDILEERIKLSRPFPSHFRKGLAERLSDLFPTNDLWVTKGVGVTSDGRFFWKDVPANILNAIE